MFLEETPDTGTPVTKENLYHSQMKMLQDFLERGAISQAQYDHSAQILTEKMPHGKP